MNDMPPEDAFAQQLHRQLERVNDLEFALIRVANMVDLGFHPTMIRETALDAIRGKDLQQPQ